MSIAGIDFTFRKIRAAVQTQPSKRAIDKTVATKIVALDGTGDFDNIQAAINALPSAGGVVYIKDGTYNIKSPITMKSKVMLRGSGKATVIQSTTGIQNIDALLDLSSLTECIIANLHVKKGSASPAYAVKFSASSRCVIESCWFDDYTSEGAIYISNNSKENRIINNEINAGDLAIWIGDTGTANDDNIIIGNVTDTGIRVDLGNRNI